MIRRLIPILILLLIAPSAFAQRSVTDDEVNEVSKGLYCPVCESEPLDTCGTQACIDWRAEIRTKLSEGATEQEIYDDFVARYGERVLAQPSARGLNLVLWLGLPVALLVGGFFFIRYMRQIRVDDMTAPAASVAGDALSSEADADEYLKRIEQELQN